MSSIGAFLFTFFALIVGVISAESECAGGNYGSVQHKMRELVTTWKSNDIPITSPPLTDLKSLPFRINVSISLTNLDVDEEDNLISVNALVYKRWNDFRVNCACRNNSYNYSQYFYLSHYEMWNPELTIQGAYSQKKEVYIDHYTSDERLMARVDGSVWLSAIGHFHFYCNMNFYLWPYDIHQCVMYLGVEGYKKNEISIQSLNFYVAWFHFDLNTDGSETKQTLNNYWQVEKVFRHTLPEIIHSSNATNHLQYALVMRIKRSSLYYSNLSHTMAIPTAICVVLSALALLLSARNSLRFHALLVSLVWHVLCLAVVCSQLPTHSSNGIFVVEALRRSLLVTMVSMALLMVNKLLLELKWTPTIALINIGDRIHAFFPWKFTYLDPPNSRPVNDVTSEWLRITSAIDKLYLISLISFYTMTIVYYAILIFTQPSPSPVARFPI